MPNWLWPTLGVLLIAVLFIYTGAVLAFRGVREAVQRERQRAKAGLHGYVLNGHQYIYVCADDCPPGISAEDLNEHTTRDERVLRLAGLEDFTGCRAQVFPPIPPASCDPEMMEQLRMATPEAFRWPADMN